MSSLLYEIISTYTDKVYNKTKVQLFLREYNLIMTEYMMSVDGKWCEYYYKQNLKKKTILSDSDWTTHVWEGTSKIYKQNQKCCVIPVHKQNINIVSLVK